MCGHAETRRALAQGFKQAANGRFRHVHSRPDNSIYLEERALDMLKHARYWFTQLTLIQALCLWASHRRLWPGCLFTHLTGFFGEAGDGYGVHQ